MNRFLRSNRKKRRVLMVDDELINRELLEAILSLNYEVFSASNGKEAMDMLYNAEEPYSLILLDLLMPQMSGFEVLQACKEDEKLREIPIIVMTSEKSAEVRSIRLGASDFITKPYRMPEVILARCERIIELSEEKRLIRSIEKDKLTGLYIRVFFEAYIRQLLPGIRFQTDVVAMKIDGLDNLDSTQEQEQVIALVARLVKKVFINSKGIACRAEDNTFYTFCEHREDHEQILEKLRSGIPDTYTRRGIRLRVAICERIDKEKPLTYWMETVSSACDKADADGGCYFVS